MVDVISRTSLKFWSVQFWLNVHSILVKLICDIFLFSNIFYMAEIFGDGPSITLPLSLTTNLD